VGDVVQVDLGDDLFTAQVIAAACEAEGLRVQLVHNEHPATGALLSVQPVYLLVVDEDLPRVREIIARSA
jgi:hypothetical protein